MAKPESGCYQDLVRRKWEAYQKVWAVQQEVWEKRLIGAVNELWSAKTPLQKFAEEVWDE